MSPYTTPSPNDLRDRLAMIPPRPYSGVYLQSSPSPSPFHPHNENDTDTGEVASRERRESHECESQKPRKPRLFLAPLGPHVVRKVY
jgi:hypothetical protein